jgi:SRSO17 transposase
MRVVRRVRKRRISEETGWLLIEDAEDKLRAWLCWRLDHWSIEELAAYAHLGGRSNSFHKDAKQVLGLDQFEGRSRNGWHHYVTVVLLAHAFIATERPAQDAAARPPPFPKVARALV